MKRPEEGLIVFISRSAGASVKPSEKNEIWTYRVKQYTVLNEKKKHADGSCDYCRNQETIEHVITP